MRTERSTRLVKSRRKRRTAAVAVVKKIEAMLASEEHAWLKGLSPEEAEALRKTYKERYNP